MALVGARKRKQIVAVFKSLVGCFLTYATIVWLSNTSKTSVNRVQVIQKSALCIATGCVGMLAIDHLRTVAKVLKVDENLSMLCAQRLAICLQPDHVSFQAIPADSAPRRMKHTLPTAYIERVGELLVDGCIRDVNFAR